MDTNDVKETILDRISAAYNAHGTFYRIVWSVAQAVAGAVAVYATGKPGAFPVVYLVAVVISSEARKTLAAIKSSSSTDDDDS